MESMARTDQPVRPGAKIQHPQGVDAEAVIAERRADQERDPKRGDEWSVVKARTLKLKPPSPR